MMLNPRDLCWKSGLALDVYREEAVFGGGRQDSAIEMDTECRSGEERNE